MKSFSQMWGLSKAFIQNHKIITLCALLLTGGVVYFLYPSAPATVALTYGRAHKGNVSETISGTGQVSATSQVELKPKVNANVTQVLVGPGDKVIKGQVLFRLDARDAYKQVRDATLSLDQAKIALAKLQQPAETIDVLTLEHAVEKIKSSKVTQDTTVATAYSNLLSANLQAVPDVSYTTEVPPTITGTYMKKTEGQIKISSSQGNEGSLITFSGVAEGNTRYSASLGQPLGDTGLFIKFNGPQSSVNWTIDIPNKRSTSYLSLYNAYTNAQQNRDIANAESDRQLAEYSQKLEDLKRGPKDIDVAAQELSVEQRQNSLNDANATLSDYTITAPFSGTMANVSAQVGLSAVTAASNGATSLGTIVTDKKIAEITLNETDIAKVHIGQFATVTFDALDNVTATGTVADIDGIGTVTQGVVTYKVKIYFDATDVRIKPSMSISVVITTSSKDGVLVVPSSAVKKDASGYYVESDGSTASFGGRGAGTSTEGFGATTTSRRFARATGTPEGASTTGMRMRTGSTTRQVASVNVPSTTVLTKIPVTIGVKGDSMTEILSGLTEGQQIIVKKVTVTTKTASAPSVTSLLRPGGAGQNRQGGVAVPAARAQ